MMKSRTLIACFKPGTVHINSVRPVQLTVQRYMCWINKQNTNVQRIPVLQISSNGESKLQNISIEEILEKGNRKFHLRDKNIFNIYAQYAWNLQNFFLINQVFYIIFLFFITGTSDYFLKVRIHFFKTYLILVFLIVLCLLVRIIQI